MSPRDFPSQSSAAVKIENTAAEWFGRRDAGLTPPEEAEFQAWLNGDPRHAAAFSRLASADSVLDGLRQFRPTQGSPDPDLPLLRELPRRSVRRRRFIFPAALAAAAAIVIIAGYFTNFQSKKDAFSRIVSTEVGGLQRITLPDGSTLELNTNTAATVAFDRKHRRVSLTRGEVHVSVAKDAARPFIVTAAGVDVQAVGTAFNVHLRTGDVDVLVTEGRVRVMDTEHGASLLPQPATAAADAPVLTAGHRAVVASTAPTGEAKPIARVTRVPELEMSRLLAWQAKRLEFEPTPLRTIIAEFNRYNAHQLVIGDPAVGELSVGGSFAVGDYDMLVRLLESSFGVTAERQANQTTLLLKR